MTLCMYYCAWNVLLVYVSCAVLITSLKFIPDFVLTFVQRCGKTWNESLGSRLDHAFILHYWATTNTVCKLQTTIQMYFVVNMHIICMHHPLNSCCTSDFVTGKWKTLKRKQKYGNGNTEVGRKAAYQWSGWLVGKGWLSLSDVRAKYGLQRALFSMTQCV